MASSFPSSIVFGHAGAGKSTLIIKVLDKEIATISTNMFKDGTKSAVACDQIIDTPGLDSKDWATSFTAIEKEVRKLLNRNFLVILVISKENGRATKWVMDFQKIMNDIFTENKFVIVWTKNCSPDKFQENKSGAAAEFGTRLLQQYDAGTESFVTEFIREASNWSTNSIKQNATSSIANPVNKMNPSGSNLKKKKRKQLLAATLQESILKDNGMIKQEVGKFKTGLNILNVLMGADGKKEAKEENEKKLFKECVQNLVDFRGTPGSSKYRPRDYSRLKCTGDAFLRCLLYAKWGLQDSAVDLDDITLKSKILINGEGGMMGKFFDQFIDKDFSNLLSVPNEEINNHTKTDFVEALIQYSMENSNVVAYNFIITWLFAKGEDQLRELEAVAA